MYERLRGLRVGIAMCGSFCTFAEAFRQAELLSALGCELYPIMSVNASTISTRFGKSADNLQRLEGICKRKAILTVADAEPIGPKKMLDVLLVMPCTSNTLSKIAGGITDTPVTMAVKSHIRNGLPVILAIATNDALGASAKNIGELLVRKNIYFVPYGQDDFNSKPLSMISHFDLAADTIESALDKKQVQPLVLAPK